jgi:spermidine synthase
MDLGPTFQTSMSLPEKEPLYHYASEMVALAGDVSGKHILIIGGAGHTQARSLEKRGATVVEVEIDPYVIDLSDRYFGEIKGEVLATDGRSYLEGLRDRRFDLIILDAYDALASVPVQLTTREFFEACNRALASDGRLIFNFIGVPSGPNANSFRAIAATMHTVFADVRASKLNGEDLTNLILIGSQTALTDSAFSPAPTEGRILTDDLNPVEVYFEQARSNYYFR